MTVNAFTQESIIPSTKSSNIFPSWENLADISSKASLADLMYREINDKTLSEVGDKFSHYVQLLPSPGEMGIILPDGLRVQAFRHNDEIIIAIRGTELNKDIYTLTKNLLADMGIGRHKSNRDLVDSLKNVHKKASRRYSLAKISPETQDILQKGIGVVEKLINTRVTGNSEYERALSIASNIASQTSEDAKTGLVTSGLLGGAIATGLVIIGAANPLVGGALAAGAMLTGGLGGASIGAAKGTVKSITAADGYQVTLDYILAIDKYVMALKQQYLISGNDEVSVVGHSLAGYLAGVIGTLHGDNIYSFNGPGVRFDEVENIIFDLGIDRKVNTLVSYQSINMECDFIGNLCERNGVTTEMYLPQTSNSNHYNSPIAHHGTDVLLFVLENSCCSPIHRNPVSSIQIEEILDDEKSAEVEA